LTPLGVAGATLDFVDAKRRDDLPGAVAAAAGLIPGAKGAGRVAAKQHARLKTRFCSLRRPGQLEKDIPVLERPPRVGLALLEPIICILLYRGRRALCK